MPIPTSNQIVQTQKGLDIGLNSGVNRAVSKTGSALKSGMVKRSSMDVRDNMGTFGFGLVDTPFVPRSK